MLFNICCLEKPSTAIFLMKQRAKLIRVKKKSTKHPVSQRLSGPVRKEDEKEEKMTGVETEQRRHLDDTPSQFSLQRTP